MQIRFQHLNVANVISLIQIKFVTANLLSKYTNDFDSGSEKQRKTA